MKNIDSTSKFLHATIFHHQAVAVGKDRREGFVVADNDDGHIGTLLGEGVIELLPVEDIEVGIWLVKQEKFGTAHEGTAEKRSLPLAAAETVDGARRKVVETQGGEGVHRLTVGFAAETAEERLLIGETGTHHLQNGDGKLAVDAAILRKIAEAQARTAQHTAGIGRRQSGKKAQKGGFTTAIGSLEYPKVERIDGQRHT